ncbi:MAG: endopeptidase La [Ilumatobacter sp.]|nr:endopeptidase La [Ilumatobacter sp.]
MSETSTTTRLPVAILPTVVLPGATLTLQLSEPGLRRAVEAARADTNGRIAFVTDPADTLGVVASVPDIGKLPGGEPVAIVQIDTRAFIGSPADDDTHLTAAVEPIIDPVPSERVTAAARELRAVLELIAPLRRSRRLPEILNTTRSPGALADAVATWAEFADDDRRRVLHAVDLADRVDAIGSWARNHLAELQVAETIRNDVSEGMDKQQREYLLRQQLNAIRRELGEGDDDVVGEFRERLERLDAPAATKNTIAKELDRFERMNSQSPEHSWIRTWLDRVFDMPWGERSTDALDLDAARAQLDADHYGLDEVKDRIVEFLATRKLRRDRGIDERDADRGGRGSGAIITLVGPPGVGKTSLGESVARAMGREFVRVALGGVRDEAEIRGHRRTYVGSQPGRLVRALQEAGTMNPVILLDEVDKLVAGGWSGDPTAALLEVLDPAQNHTFRDHYLEVDLDLSEVVFIATANVADTIPAPLLDRMDLVRLDGYTEDEKRFIADRYLLPRQIDQAGLRPDEIEIGDDVVSAIIRGYTREAGVRTLERELGRLVRKVAAKVATGTTTPVTIDPDEVSTWLGRAKVSDDVPERTNVPGVATGLAVTGVGGDVLFVETTAFPTGPDAEPGLTLTGQLGDVMKESAQIALNYVRSHADELGLDDEALRRRFHVHVPAGAVPKDGPSAGITMTTALVSLITGRHVKPSVGMTGEITLQGQVLPIGGVKQKVLAAHRMGLTEIVLPKRNGPDLDDVPERVRAEMTFHLADTYADVAAVAFA